MNHDTTPSQDDCTFILDRTFNVPRSLLFDAWTKPEHLAKWWGPAGCAIDIQTLDVKPGGVFHYCMTFSNGMQMWGIFHYREISPPDRLVYVNSFSNPQGEVTRAPFADDWPLEMLNTVTFESLGEKQTRLVLHSTPINASAAQRQTFKDGFASMTQGWGGSFEVLANYLATLGR